MQDCYLIKWLEEQIGFESYQHLSDRSLERISSFFLDYKNKLLKKNVKIITIAGTNGKGQTSYSAASLLGRLGHSYGLFLSPHVHSVTERFQSHQGMIDKDRLYSIFKKIKSRQELLKMQLSFFEFLFAAFLEMSLEDNLSILILEVGVGGRLDATNLLDADVSIITSIGRDHQELLGSRLDSILSEKMGILRKDQYLFTAISSKYLLKLILDKSSALQVIHHDVSERVKKTYGNYFEYTNRYLALLAVKNILPLEDWKNFNEKIYIESSLKLPGRGEVLIHRDMKLHLYGSHNLDGMRAWIKSDLVLRRELIFDQVLIAFSKRATSDILNLVKLWLSAHLKYKNKYKTLIITTFDHAKAYNPNEREVEQLKLLLNENNQTIKWLSSWKEYNRFSRINTVSNILIIGSFYFVSDVKEHYTEVFI